MAGLPPLPDPAGIGVNIPLKLMTPQVTKAENDMTKAWHELQRQMGPVTRARMLRATFYRARLKQVVRY